MKPAIILISALLVMAPLTGCSSGPDPKVVGAQITKAWHTRIDCTDAQVDDTNSDDSFVQEEAWSAVDTCLTDFAQSLEKISIADEFKSDYRAVLAAAINAGDTAGNVSANTDDVSNYNDAFDAHTKAKAELSTAMTKLLIDYDQPTTY